MDRLGDVLWADCIRALRRAGFVCAAESPKAVMLVSAGRSVFLPRALALDEIALLGALRAIRLDPVEFLALLRDPLPVDSSARPQALSDEMPQVRVVQGPNVLEELPL
jgi:hypothetical protein